LNRDEKNIEFLLKDKVLNVIDLIETSMALRVKLRKNTDAILREKNKWILSLNDIQNDSLIISIEEREMKITIEESFHLYFIQQKLKSNK
jgi:hypothetical protein